MSEKAWWTLLLLGLPFLYIVTFPIVDVFVFGFIRYLLPWNAEVGDFLKRANEAYGVPMRALMELMGYR